MPDIDIPPFLTMRFTALPSSTRLPRLFGLFASMAAAALLFTAQPVVAQAAPPITYSKDGVSFDHPPGWKVADDVVAQDETRLRSIDIEGPDEAIVTFMFSPFLAGQDIEKFAAAAARNRENAARSNTAQQLRMGMTTESPIARDVGGKESKGVSQRFVVSLLGQDLPHEARFFKAALAGTTVIVMTQVASEHASAVEPGFAMTLGSLRYSPGKR